MYEQNNQKVLFVRFFLFVQYNGGIVMTFRYAKTQKASRRFDESYSEDKPERLGGLQDQSRIYGSQPFGFDPEDCSRESKFGSNSRNGETSPGKIFERLGLIEDAFLAYIHSHQDDLKTKLEESVKKEQDFLDIITHLKEEIYQLVSEEKTEELDE